MKPVQRMNLGTWDKTKWLPDNRFTAVGLRVSAPKSVYPAVL